MIECSIVPSIDNRTIGIVFPIYAWGAPEPVLEFVKKLACKPAFTFGVCTCGAEAVCAMEKLSSRFPLNSTCSVAMPSNYIIAADVNKKKLPWIKSVLANFGFNKFARSTKPFYVTENALLMDNAL